MNNSKWQFAEFKDWYNGEISLDFLDDVLAYRDVDPERQRRLFENWLQFAFAAGRKVK